MKRSVVHFTRNEAISCSSDQALAVFVVLFFLELEVELDIFLKIKSQGIRQIK